MASSVRIGRGEVRVAESATLVVTKCNAYSQRRSHGDLVDIARLALSDFRAGRLPEALLELLRKEEQHWQVYKDSFDAFQDSDGEGASAFLSAILDSPRAEPAAWLDHEEDVRRVTILAVQRMFHLCPLREEDQ